MPLKDVCHILPAVVGPLIPGTSIISKGHWLLQSKAALSQHAGAAIKILIDRWVDVQATKNDPVLGAGVNYRKSQHGHRAGQPAALIIQTYAVRPCLPLWSRCSIA